MLSCLCAVIFFWTFQSFWSNHFFWRILSMQQSSSSSRIYENITLFFLDIQSTLKQPLPGVLIHFYQPRYVDWLFNWNPESLKNGICCSLSKKIWVWKNLGQKAAADNLPLSLWNHSNLGSNKEKPFEWDLNLRHPDHCAGSLPTDLSSPILWQSPYFVNILVGGGGSSQKPFNLWFNGCFTLFLLFCNIL